MKCRGHILIGERRAAERLAGEAQRENARRQEQLFWHVNTAIAYHFPAARLPAARSLNAILIVTF
jgi:hypothetical protein